CFFLFYSHVNPRDLHSFPTRRSSDLPCAVQISCTRRASVCPPTRPSLMLMMRHAFTSIADSACCALLMHSSRQIDVLSCDCSFRSEEHTSELQSRSDLVCRLLLEKKK